MLGSSSWMPYAPRGVKGFDDDNDDETIIEVDTEEKQKKIS